LIGSAVFRGRPLFCWVAALVVAAGFACQPARPAGGGGAERPRVVSLHDVTTEIAVALGAVDRLVGVGEPVQLPDQVKAAVAGVPRVAGVESILAQRPTVVLGTAVVAQRSPDLVAFLRSKGAEVWLGHPTNLDDVFGLVTAVGARMEAQREAEALGARLRARAVAAPAPVESPPLRVFVYDCCDPAFTAGRGAVLSDLIRRAGGRNVFDDVDADWTKVSWEQVTARRPQLIVIHDYEYEGQGGVDRKRKQLEALRSLASVPVTVMPLGYSLGGLRSLEGLEHLRRVIRETGGRG
jgi:iron complex transport system substrate-binding protein